LQQCRITGRSPDRREVILVNTREKRACVELFERRCRDHGVPLTVQRRAILETVLDLASHPTADEVYEAVAAGLPGISRTTAYRSLETLVRMGVITKVSHLGSAVRYDARIELHHHLVCLRCDRIVDFSDARFDALPIPDTSAQGFQVRDFRVQFRGLCRRCRRMEAKR
jgi:Fur family transcriptional regulator, peroxide stress response regulator